MSTITLALSADELNAAIEAGTTLMQAACDERGIDRPTMKFVKLQGPQSTANGAAGRTFSVSGPKADVVRALVFADQGFTRKQLAAYAGCSVSRVAEVVWGLEHDGLEFPEIPLREAKVAETTEAPAEPLLPRE